jgi:hypothetical protein
VKATGTDAMNAIPSRAVIAAAPAIARTAARGFLHIVRHGGGPSAVYVVTYQRLDRDATVRPRPVPAEGAQSLIELLERIGVDFRVKEVREALEDILRLGSANIPDLWLTDEQMVEKGLVES